MKEIKENGRNELQGYKELKNGEKFIYVNDYEWFAVKINEEYAVFLNGEKKFIVAKKYKNLLSIGDFCPSFSSYEEAEDYALTIMGAKKWISTAGAAAIPLKETRKQCGMTQKQFAEYFGIPFRTIQNWEGGQRRCPEYLLNLMRYKLEKEDIKKEG